MISMRIKIEIPLKSNPLPDFPATAESWKIITVEIPDAELLKAFDKMLELHGERGKAE